MLTMQKLKINFSKRTIIILTTIFLLVITGRIVQKVYGYSFNGIFYKTLTKIGLVERSFRAIPDIIDISAQEGFDYHQFDTKIVLDSLDKLLDKNIKAETLKVPPITHHVYLTSLSNPIGLNYFFIEKMKLHFEKFNSLENGWQHIIWTNKLDLFPQELKAIPGVIIKEVNEFNDQPIYQNLVEMLAKGNDARPYLAAASDVLRSLAVQKYGGIYTDMDYEIYDPELFFDLMKKFDFIGGRETVHLYSYYGNSFMAAKPNHPVLNEMLKTLLRNHKGIAIPDYVKYPCNGNDGIYFNGPPLLTFAYFKENNIEGNTDIILPAWMGFNIKFARVKNKSCELAKMSKEFVDQNNENRDKLLADFISSFKLKSWESEPKNAVMPADNIYYNVKYYPMFKVVGADMFCGSWVADGNGFKRNYYWTWKTKN